jgi:acyl-CoA thioester hydrolase
MTLTLRIDWSELDLFGHVNNVSFFKYQQAARVAYWERIGLSTLSEGITLGPLLASATVDFRKPLHYPGMVRIETHVSYIRNTSFGLEHRMYDAEGNLCAEGRDAVVLFDYSKGEKVSVPHTVRQKVEAEEGQSFPPPQA